MGTTTTDIQAAQRQIAAAIEAGGLSRSEIAARMGVSPGMITHALDTGRKPKPETLNAIAECVGLQVRVAVLPLPKGESGD